MKTASMKSRSFLVAGLMLAAATYSLGQSHPSVNAFSSDPGAAFTIYLDFAGFTYNGNWDGLPPGTTQAYLGVSGSYTAAQQTQIETIWARTAEKYAGMNVNVTTVDPAIAAAQAANDSTRQAYYDNTARVMHSVVSGNGSWFGGGGGVSYVGVTDSAQPGTGHHTNWIFADQSPSDLQFIGEANAHENGHGLKLSHQSDYSGNTLVNEYSFGSGTGNGSYAPIMGDSYSAQRGTWRSGDSHNGSGSHQQNDMQLLLTNNGMSLMDDGIGHSLATATNLALTGSVVDFNLAHGTIVPKSSAAPNPIGEANYTGDFYSFSVLGGVVTLTVHDGSQHLVAGVADPGATLNSKLRILDATGNIVGTGALDTSTLFETFSGNLAAGNYFAQVVSNGGFSHTGQFGTQSYYDMGDYFLTGRGFTPVPEPASMVMLGLGVVALVRRRRAK